MQMSLHLKNLRQCLLSGMAGPEATVHLLGLSGFGIQVAYG